jgi:hypothetical protein
MIDFSCEIVGRGWIKAILNSEGKETVITGSYLSNAPADMIMAVALLFEGRRETECAWQEEPGQYKWLFKKEKRDISIQVLWINKAFRRKCNEDGEIVFSAIADLLHFSRMVLRVFNTISLKYTAEEYRKIWGYDFPVQELSRLKDVLQKNRILA